MPVLVAYDLYDTECGTTGATSPAAYRRWISELAAGIAGRPAAVVLEPDALAAMGCLPAPIQATQLALLNYAVAVLGVSKSTTVYIDAGNAPWQPAATMAQRLREAGVAKARGFSLNVSNYLSTAGEISYGDKISSLLGGAHFVIDTSRNGAPSDGNWCNQAGARLGTDPTTSTGNPLVDALLWIKYPGESDGTCGGGPTAGAWWPAYALGLAGSGAP